MRRLKVGTDAIESIAVFVVLCMAHQAQAQAATAAYPNMAPVEQYLMNRTAEIALARSAAPDSISRDATVLVLGRQGYETAVEGKNGFVCIVARAWTATFDWPEYWNPKVRAADCMNPQSARSILPVVSLRTRMAIAGHSKAEIEAAIETAYEKKELPNLETGAMDYMMSRPSYLTGQRGHNMAHLMFYLPFTDGKDWGSGAAGSPVMSSPYWFMSSTELKPKGLPPILVFLVPVADWSDGTPAGQHSH